MPVTHRYSRFPGFSWSIRSDRATRTVSAVAAAALAGTVVGGLSAFAVVNALTAPPRQDMAAAQATGNSPQPIRTFDAAVPDPSAGMTAGAPVPARPVLPIQAQTAAPAAPAAPAQTSTVPAGRSPQATWPDALSRAHAAMPAAPEAATAQSPTAPPAPDAVSARPVVRVPNDATTDASAQAARMPEPAKKRATVTYRAPQPDAAESREATRQKARPIYDHFWGKGVSKQNTREDDARAPYRWVDPADDRDRPGGRDDRDD
jgi:hypothetical protein